MLAAGEAPPATLRARASRRASPSDSQVQASVGCCEWRLARGSLQHPREEDPDDAHDTSQPSSTRGARRPVVCLHAMFADTARARDPRSRNRCRDVLFWVFEKCRAWCRATSGPTSPRRREASRRARKVFVARPMRSSGMQTTLLCVFSPAKKIGYKNRWNTSQTCTWKRCLQHGALHRLLETSRTHTACCDL